MVEKILAEGENLPPLAGVAGTTGYDALNDIARVLLEPRGLTADRRDAGAGDRRMPRLPGDAGATAKRLVLGTILASEFTRARRGCLARIAAGH